MNIFSGYIWSLCCIQSESMLFAALILFGAAHRRSRRRSRNAEQPFYVRQMEAPFSAGDLLRPDRAYFRSLDDSESDHQMSLEMIKNMRDLVKKQHENEIAVSRYKDVYRRYARKARELIWEKEQDLMRRQHAQKRYFKEVARVANPRAYTDWMIGGGN